MKFFWSAILLSCMAACTPIRKSEKSEISNAQGKGCVYDRQSMLTQELDVFDQSASGVRSIYAKNANCKKDAADLIHDYRLARPETLDDFNSYLLFWHEGQLRAEIGDYAGAIPLFEGARMSNNVGPEVGSIWNFYVDATIAFAKRDRAALVAARESLAAVPKNYLRGAKQPPNLNVVDGLVSCFDRPYSEAYNLCKKNSVGINIPARHEAIQ